MSLLRCSRSLFRSPSLGFRAVSIWNWRPTSCLLGTEFQTRGKHSRPSRLPQKPIPGQPQHQQPSRLQGQDPNQDEILFAPNEGQYQHREGHRQEEPEFPRVRIRFLRPAIWAISVSSGIYVSLAYLEAKEELKPRNLNPFRQYQPQRPTPPTPTEVVTGVWNQLNPMSKLIWGIIGANGVVHLAGMLAPRYWDMLWHTPARNVNYSLLTSAFVHSGAFHFIFNMWACYNFLPPVGYSRLFRGDTYHTLSFFLSTGILSGYAQHMASAVFRGTRAIPSIFIPSGGASGALFAMFGAFCMQYPDQRVGIIFIPFHVEAQYFLPAIMLFDLVGMIRGYPFVSFGHGAHLAGASLGVAYSYFDGHNNAWRPLVGFWKRRIQSRL